MGARGPAPTPSALLKLRGSWRAEQNPDEPKPTRGRPPMPKHLAPEGKKLWKRLVPELDQTGVLTLEDGPALELLCERWASYRTAVEFIQANGTTYPIHDRNGKVRELKQFPQVKERDQLAAQVARLMQEFGITPSSRTRVAADRREKDAGGFDHFVSSRGAG